MRLRPHIGRAGRLGSHHDRDRGLGLVEMLVNITVLGLVVSALASVLVTLLRLHPMLEASTDRSQMQMSLAVIFRDDVRSTPPEGVSLATDASGCSPDEPGRNLVELTTVTHDGRRVVGYRLVTSAQQRRIVRVACNGDAAGSWTLERTVSFPTTSIRSGTAEPVVELVDGTVVMVLAQPGRQVRLSARPGSMIGGTP